MRRIRIIGPKSILDRVVDLLQEVGVVHIESVSLPAEAKELERFSLDRDREKKKAEWDGLFREMSRLILALPERRTAAIAPGVVEGEGLSAMNEAVYAEIKSTLEMARGEIDSILGRIRTSQEESNLLSKYERVLEAMSPLLQEIKDVKGLDFVGLILDVPLDESAQEGSRGGMIRDIRQALAEATDGRYELFLSRADRETVAALLVVPHDLTAKVRLLLWEENISELRLPSYAADRPIGEALKILLKRRTELPVHLQQLRGELETLSLRWRSRLQRYKRIIENWLAQLESTVYFYQTRSTFLVYGWIPDGDLPQLQQRMRESFSGQVVMEIMKVVRDELRSAPVALKNPRAMRPFETFTKLIALPRYGTCDPTPYIAFFFPLFFGLILGDIGYGLILMGLSLYARKRWKSWPTMRDLSAIFLLSAFSSVVFGFLYGEFFGELGGALGIHPILLSRMDGFLQLIQITLAIGLIHVALGIGLGLITAIRDRDYRELATKISGLAFLVALVAVIAALMDLIPPVFATIGGFVILGAVVALFVMGGARAAMELHNVVNVLSYLRLMGIGVASAALAFTANTLAGLIGNIVLGVFIGIIFHFINLVFGVFSPTIQSLRLHYVEFYENFFQGGGREYRPFKRI